MFCLHSALIYCMWSTAVVAKRIRSHKITVNDPLKTIGGKHWGVVWFKTNKKPWLLPMLFKTINPKSVLGFLLYYLAEKKKRTLWWILYWLLKLLSLLFFTNIDTNIAQQFNRTYLIYGHSYGESLVRLETGFIPAKILNIKYYNMLHDFT